MRLDRLADLHPAQRRLTDVATGITGHQLDTIREANGIGIGIDI